MAELINMPRAAWKRQPQGAVELAPKYRAELLSFYSPFQSIKWQSFGAGIALRTEKYGVGCYFGASSYLYADFPSRAMSSDYTMLTVFMPTVVSSVGVHGIYSGSSFISYLYINSSGQLNVYNSGAGTLTLVPSPSLASGNFITSQIRHRYGDQRHTARIDGKKYNTNASVTSALAFYRDRIGAQSAGGYGNSYFVTALWGRIVEDDLTENPWQLFSPDPARFYLILSSGTTLINLSQTTCRRQPQGMALQNSRWINTNGVLFNGGDGVTYSGSSTRAIQQDGVVDAFDGTADYRELVAPEASNPTKSSCVVRFRVNAAPSGDSGAVVSRHHAGELIWIGSSGVLAVFDTTTGWIYGGLPAEYGLGRWMTVAFSVESNVRMKGWVDGHLFCDVAIGEIGQYIAFPFWLGRVAYTGVSGYLNCSISCVYYTESIVPDALLRDFSSNPWQLFRPAPSRFILIPSSGSVFSLIVQDCAVANTFDAPFLTQAHVLALADVLHVSTIDQPSLSSAYALTLAAAVHNVVVDTPNLTQSNTLTVVETNQDIVVDTPNLTQSQIIEIAEINQDVIIDGLTLTQAHVLTLENTLYGVLSEELTLAVAGSLIIADSSHSIAIDVPAFTQSNTITVADTSQSTTINGALGLTQAFVVSVADTAQSLTLDAPTLSTELNLTVSDSVSSVALDAPVLTQAQILALAELLHSTTVDSFVLGQGFTLVVAGITQEVVYDAPVLTQSFVLAVLDALHNQVFDVLNLAMHLTLVVSDALCTVLVGTASEISLTPQFRVFLVQAEDRLFVIFPEDRTFGVS